MTRPPPGDEGPARTLALLWRRHRPAPTRGPRPTLSVDEVVASATALANAEGLEAVTMRRLAQQLGVAPMALYTYVPDKTELLHLMVDGAYASMTRTAPADRGWRARVEAVALDNLRLYQRCPWLASVSTHRPPLGPGLMGKYEHELGAFEDTPLDEVETDAALSFVLAFVASCARAATDQSAVERETRMNDQAWWEANQPLLSQVFDARVYPRAARIGAAAGAAHGAASSPSHAFSFGLDRVLDGLAALIDARSAPAPRAGARRSR